MGWDDIERIYYMRNVCLLSLYYICVCIYVYIGRATITITILIIWQSSTTAAG